MQVSRPVGLAKIEEGMISPGHSFTLIPHSHEGQSKRDTNERAEGQKEEINGGIQGNRLWVVQ